MKMLTLKISEVNAALDNGEFPNELMELIEKAISDAEDSPGATDDVTITLVLTNDLEPEEDEEEESEDEESDDTTTETKE